MDSVDLADYAEMVTENISRVLSWRISGQVNGKMLRKMVRGGKRLRPLLCILSFRASRGREEAYTRALEVAAGVELGHCASLCHDDIVDRDLTRRRCRAMWVEDGIPEALLAGHRAVSLGLAIFLAHGEEVAETYLKAWDIALQGAEMEADARRRGRVSAGRYLKIIEEKTASLFWAAAKAGCQIADAPLNLQQLLGQYGIAVGMAYQIADDLSEVGEEKQGELWSLVGSHRTGGTTQKFLEERMAINIAKAEVLARDERIPESTFKDYLAQLPRHCVSQIMGESRGVEKEGRLQGWIIGGSPSLGLRQCGR